MRILMVNPHFPPINSGSGSVTLELSRALRERGHEVCILTVDAERRAAFRDEFDGFDVYRVPARQLGLGRIALNYSLPFAISAGLRKAVNHVLDVVQPDVVHLHGQFWDLNMVAGRGAKTRGVPVVLTVHTVIVNPDPRIAAVLRLADRLVVKRLMSPSVERWTGYDQRVLDYINDRYGVRDAEFLPNPVRTIDLASARPTEVRARLGLESEPIVLSVGHVIAGLRDRVSLVRAFAELLQSVPAAKLVVVGKVNDRTFLDVADALGVRDAVLAVGEIPHSEIHDWLAAAVAECHDLSGIGIGVATIEAMTAGVPVVMVLRDRDIPGVNLADYPGLARLEDDVPSEIAAELRTIIESSDYAREVAATGLRFAADCFSRETVVESALRLYRHVSDSSV